MTKYVMAHCMHYCGNVADGWNRAGKRKKERKCMCMKKVRVPLLSHKFSPLAAFKLLSLLCLPSLLA
jgi:hypothetical protein